MLVTCPQCQTQYKLDTALLGMGGRTVRCTSCFHMWDQKPEQASAHQNLSFEDNAAVAEQIGFREVEKAPPAKPALPDEDTFADILKQTEPDSYPSIARPLAKQSPAAALTHMPFGVSALHFGVLTFMLLSFVTLTIIFAGRNFIATHAPSMMALYAPLGFDIKAPGEGFTISEMTAEAEIVKEKKSLLVDARLANITEHDMAHPKLKMTMKGRYGAVLKEWDYDGGGKTVASGDSIPLNFEFANPPEGGTTVEIKVTD